MTNQFTQATKNLLRTIRCSSIVCPRFAQENREALQQFLYKFAAHIVDDMLRLGMNTELEKEHLERALTEISDMPEEQQA